jgi:hypothetical protein
MDNYQGVGGIFVVNPETGEPELMASVSREASKPASRGKTKTPEVNDDAQEHPAAATGKN